MTFLDKLRSRLELVKDTTMNTANIVPDSIKQERLSICDSCPYLFRPTMQCQRCGCFLKIKTSFAFFKCPEGKWKSVTNDEVT